MCWTVGGASTLAVVCWLWHGIVGIMAVACWGAISWRVDVASASALVAAHYQGGIVEVLVGVLALALAGSWQQETMMPVILPPTMQQLPGTLLQLQPVDGVVVGGAMICGAPPTKGDEKKTKAQRGKAKVEIVCCWHCEYCTQHGKGARSMSMCTGGQGGGLSLECILCNSITKCKCLSNGKDKGLNV